MYSEWRACERLGMTPPGIDKDYGNNPAFFKALILAYNEIRSREETEMAIALAGGTRHA